MPSWVIYAILSAFFAALTAILAKAGLKEVNSDLATAIRTGVVLVITWAIVIVRGYSHQISGLSKNTWLFLILSGIATGISWLFYYKALQQGRTAEVNTIDKSSLVFTILLAFLFLKEPITLRTGVAALLIIAGMLVLVWK